MYVIVSKETRLNIRISPLFKDDLQRVADFHGLTVSSYVHSVLVKQIRLEKEREPEAFVTRQLAPVVATIKNPRVGGSTPSLATSNIKGELYTSLPFLLFWFCFCPFSRFLFLVFRPIFQNNIGHFIQHNRHIFFIAHAVSSL